MAEGEPGVMMKKLSVFFLLFTCIPLILSALTIDQGRIRLILHENSGRFSIYYLDDIEKNTYVSLLFERDPRTSSVGLLLNNKLVTLGSSTAFRQSVERTVNGARFIWESSSVKVIQSFSFVKSDPFGLSDGISIQTQVKNISEDVQTIGVHLLLDTYLSEEQDAHFITSDGLELDNETEYTLRIPQYWMTKSEDSAFVGLQSLMKGNGITLPDRVIFSNWKRLSENLWNIQAQENRNFNLLPYSINDSAVCQFYDPMQLGPGASRTVVALLGAYTTSQFSLDNAAEIQSSSVEQVLSTTSPANGEDVEDMVQKDLIATNEIISNINSLLSFPDEITDEKIEVIRRAIQNLKVKKNQYQSSQ